MNKELKAYLDYWSTWNIPRNPSIQEGASDGSARELAQMASKEIKRLNAVIKKLKARKRA